MATLQEQYGAACARYPQYTYLVNNIASLSYSVDASIMQLYGDNQYDDDVYKGKRGPAIIRKREQLFATSLTQRELYILPLESRWIDFEQAIEAVQAGRLMPLLDFDTAHGTGVYEGSMRWYMPGVFEYLARRAMKQLEVLDYNTRLELSRQGTVLGPLLNYFKVGFKSASVLYGNELMEKSKRG